MKTKIINYEPGAKGDFVINFLNDKLLFESLGQSSASAGSDTRVIAQGLPNDQLDQYVDILLDKDYEEHFISSHSLHLMSTNMLQRLKQKYDLYHILIDTEWKEQVNIDGAFKMLIKEAHPSLIEKYQSDLKFFNVDIDSIKYNIDLKYIHMRIPISNESRIMYLKRLIKENRAADINPLIECLPYKEMFLEPFDSVKKLRESIDKKFDETFFKFSLKQSFLPKTIDAFGHTFNIEELGYRYYI